MRIYFSKIKIFFVFVTIIFLNGLCVFAQENIISSIAISKAKDNINSYTLNINSTDKADYKMGVAGDLSVYFDLKNSVLSDDVSTYYDDVPNIDSIAVKQISNNKVRIYLQGKNVKNTRLVFLNSLYENTKTQPKKITINRPISEYAPTNIDLKETNNLQEWDDNFFNFNRLLKTLKEGNKGMVPVFLAIFGVVFYIIRLVFEKMTQDEPLIGLKQQNYDIEENMQPVEFNSQNNLGNITKKTKALKTMQREVSKAHSKYQQYLQSKNNVPKKQFITDSITKGIALNQYQKSNQNPYQNQPVIKFDRSNISGITSNIQNNQGNFKIRPKVNLYNPQNANSSVSIQKK